MSHQRKRHALCIPIRGICECPEDLRMLKPIDTSLLKESAPEPKLEWCKEHGDISPCKACLFKIKQDFERQRIKNIMKEAVAEALAERD